MEDACKIMSLPNSKLQQLLKHDTGFNTEVSAHDTMFPSKQCARVCAQ